MSVKVYFWVFEESPDSSGDESFEASGCFSFGLALAGSHVHVCLGLGAASLTGDRDEVKRPVEFAIASSVESVPVLVQAGGHLDRCGSAESSERCFAPASARV